jgi:hypothetical protein
LSLVKNPKIKNSDPMITIDRFCWLLAGGASAAALVVEATFGMLFKVKWKRGERVGVARTFSP